MLRAQCDVGTEYGTPCLHSSKAVAIGIADGRWKTVLIDGKTMHICSFHQAYPVEIRWRNGTVVLVHRSN